MRYLHLYEPSWRGHRMQHVYRLTKAAEERGIVTCLYTTPRTARNPIVLQMCEEFGGSLIVRTLAEGTWALRKTGTRNLRIRSLAEWLVMRMLHLAIPATEQGPLFLPWIRTGDLALSILGTPFGSRPWHTLTAIDRFHDHKVGIEPKERKNDRTMERRFLRLLRRPTLKTVFTLDASLEQYVHGLGLPEGGKVLWIPDPVEVVPMSTEEARAALNIPLGARVVLVFGSLEARKNVAPLTKALVSQDATSGDVLLLVGLQSPEFKEALESAGVEALRAAGRLIEFDSFVSKAVEYQAFAAADVVWAGYVNHLAGGSGVLFSAAAAGKPTLATRQGIMGWMAREHDSGLLIGGQDVDEIVSALSRLAVDSGLRERLAANGRELAARHETRHFTEAILDRLFSESKPG